MEREEAQKTKGGWGQVQMERQKETMNNTECIIRNKNVYCPGVYQYVYIHYCGVLR